MFKKALKYIGIFILSYICLSILLTVAYIVINPPVTILMMQRPSKVERQWVDIDEISPNIIQAVVASEDNLFLSHSGFDFEQIKIAIEESKRKNKPMRGASTISQQTAKNVFWALFYCHQNLRASYFLSNRLPFQVHPEALQDYSET